MKGLNRISNRLKGFTKAITRYPLSAAFLLAIAVINAYTIENTEFESYRYIMALGIGVILAAALQMLFENFFQKSYIRFILMGAAAVLTAFYYLTIQNAARFSMEIGIKTGVAAFVLIMAFIWVPTIKNRINFNESFISVFKAFFISLLFSSVLFGGIALIIGATDQLLFHVDEELYIHMANIVYVLYAFLYFFSLTPHYPGYASNIEGEVREEEEQNGIIETDQEYLAKAIKCPKFIELLISYIIIPLTAVFNIILVLYILLNISGDFWKDNLLEPMLVIYTVTVINVYVLSSTLTNKFARIFRKIFPKVLVPIVVFQLVASILKIGEAGVTHGRYYVILFGLFAVIAGLVFSFLDVRKNGIIAAVLMLLCTVSLLPPVDAFTVAKNNQLSILESTLEKNGMLKDNKVSPNPSITETDKSKIISTYEYLRNLDYLDEVEWMEDYDVYIDFKKMFGFEIYETYVSDSSYIYVNTKQSISTDIEGYDTFALTYVYIENDSAETSEIAVFAKDGKTYTLVQEFTDGTCSIRLLDEEKTELVRYDLKEAEDKYMANPEGETTYDIEDLTFIKSTDTAQMKIILRELNINRSSDYSSINATLFLFVKIKV